MNLGGHPSNSNRTIIFGAIVFVAALLLRGAFLYYFSESPLFSTPVMDMSYFHRWALAVAKGGSFADSPYFKAPLYPLFAAEVYRLFGSGDWALRVVQSLIGSLSAVFTFLIGVRLFDRTVGFVAGLVVATASTLIIFDSQILVPTLFIFLCLLALYEIVIAVQSGRWLHWAAAGVVLGLAAITRPTILLFAFGLLLWLAIKAVRDVASRKTLVAVALCLVVAIAPVTIRNFVVSDQFVPIATYGGVNLYIGNNLAADGVTTYLPGTGLDWWGDGAMTEAKAIAEADVGHRLTAAERSAYWQERAIGEMSAHPDFFLKLVLRRFLLVMGGYELANNVDVTYLWRGTGILRPLLIGFPVYYPWGILLPLALLGMFTLPSWRTEHRLLAWFVAASAAPLLIYFVTARYRLPMLPVLAMFASYAVVRGWRRWNAIPIRTRVVAVTVVLVVLVLGRIDFFGYARSQDAQGDHMMASIYSRNGDLARAERFYRRALASDSTLPHANNDLGLLLMHRGKYDEAIRLFHRAVNARPDDYLLEYNLGVGFLESGQTDSAITCFRDVVTRIPGSYDAANNLGRAWLTKGAIDSALAAYRLAAEAAPDYPDGHYAVAYCYDLMGKTDSARTHYYRALDTNRNYARAYYGLGGDYVAERRPDSARICLETFLKLSPGGTDLDARARYLLDSLRAH